MLEDLRSYFIYNTATLLRVAVAAGAILGELLLVRSRGM